jgi:hypothetical protein
MAHQEVATVRAERLGSELDVFARRVQRVAIAVALVVVPACVLAVSPAGFSLEPDAAESGAHHVRLDLELREAVSSGSGELAGPHRFTDDLRVERYLLGFRLTTHLGPTDSGQLYQFRPCL